MLDDDRAKRIVIHYLGKQLENQNGSLAGFVVMPDHVHAMVSFTEPGMLSVFMSQWKRRSSMGLKNHFQKQMAGYTSHIDLDGAMWQPKYYVFHIHSEAKAVEKLSYMHNNPVRKGLVTHAGDWAFGSASWYVAGKPVGVPITPFGA